MRFRGPPLFQQQTAAAPRDRSLCDFLARRPTSHLKLVECFVHPLPNVLEQRSSRTLSPLGVTQTTVLWPMDAKTKLPEMAGKLPLDRAIHSFGEQTDLLTGETKHKMPGMALTEQTLWHGSTNNRRTKRTVRRGVVRTATVPIGIPCCTVYTCLYYLVCSVGLYGPSLS